MLFNNLNIYVIYDNSRQVKKWCTGSVFREFKITEKEEKKRKKYDRYKSNIKKKYHISYIIKFISSNGRIDMVRRQWSPGNMHNVGLIIIPCKYDQLTIKGPNLRSPRTKSLLIFYLIMGGKKNTGSYTNIIFWFDRFIMSRVLLFSVYGKALKV